MAEVEVTIDRIVLTGLDVPPGRREFVRRLVASELSALLREHPLQAAQSARAETVEAPELHLPRPATDGQTARGVARSISSVLRDTS